MSDDVSALARRDWLVTGGIALGGLALPAGSSGEEIVAHPARARLSLNENSFGPSSFALAAIGKQLGEVCHYPDDGGDRLTRAIVTRENVSADQIVLGEILGPLGLHLAMNGPGGGDSSIRSPATPPSWMRWRPVERWSFVPLDQYLQNDLSAIAAKLSSRTRAIYLVNPHNPSGTVNDTESFTTFVRDMSKRTTVIVDEAYLEFEPDFAARTAAGLRRAGENVVVFRTFGKIYGLAGLSMGYAVAPQALAASLIRARIGVPETLDRLALAAATASLRDRGYIATIRAKVIAEREKWNSLFDGSKLQHSDSRGNFVFFETGRPTRTSRRRWAQEVSRLGAPFLPSINGPASRSD